MRKSGVGYNAFSKCIATVLLAAAALQAHELASSRVVSTIVASRGFRVLHLELELIFGICLLAGIYPQATRIVGMAFFAAMCGISAFSVARGDISCGCFGALRVSAWFTLGFDFCALLGFWALKPASIS